jgi:hypothetical protein
MSLRVSCNRPILSVSFCALSRAPQALDTEGASVVTHCSDGWDRTSQLSALSQLCLDPFYRTQRGFAVLIEKEWLSFGHKFAERCGHASADYGHDQRAPIFLQFLDCVWQITRQFPLSFEFHDRFLIEIADHMVSGAFGTFLFDCERERQESTLSRRTPSLWTWLLGSHGRCALFRNPLYRPHPGKLLPVATARRVVLWEAYFMRYDPLHREQESVADAAALMHARRIYRVDHLMALNLPPDTVLLGEDDLLDRRLAATVEMREDARAQVEDRAMAQREAHRLMSASAHMELLSDFDEGRMRLSAVNAAAADAVEAAEARKNGGGCVSSAAAASAALLAIAEGACEVEVAETDDFLIESRERDSSVPFKPAMLLASRGVKLSAAATSAPSAASAAPTAPGPLRRMISSPDPLMAVGAGSVQKVVIPVLGSAANAAHSPQPSGPPPPRPSAAALQRDAVPIPSVHRDTAPTPSMRRDVAPPPKK